MTGRLARWALKLYPLGFQRRYGDEMRALLDQTPARLTTLLDLLRGAFSAHLHPPEGLEGLVGVSDRLRASTTGVLACWVIFAAAGFGFYKTTEDAQFAAAGNAHGLLGGAHVAVQILAIIASSAVMLGALPLIVLALAQARREPSLRGLVSTPILAVIAFAGITAVVVLFAHSAQFRHTVALDHGLLIAWLLAGLACGAVCVVASRRALFAVSVPRRRLTTALVFGTLVTGAMAAMTLSVALYAIALQLDESGLAATSNGPTSSLTTATSLIAQVIVMAAAAALAGVSTRRGWRTLSHPAPGQA